MTNSSPTARLVAISVACGALAIAGFASAGVFTDWDQGAAAWVQAAAASLGMAIAIGVAGWQGVQARTLVRDQANADLLRRLEAVMGLLQAANHEVWRWRRFLVRRPTSSRRDVQNVATLQLPFIYDLDRLETALANVVLHELPSWDLAEAILLARQALSDTKSAGTQIFHGIEMGRASPNPLVPQIEMAAKAISIGRSTQERLLGVKLPALLTEHHQEP